MIRIKTYKSKNQSQKIGIIMLCNAQEIFIYMFNEFDRNISEARYEAKTGNIL